MHIKYIELNGFRTYSGTKRAEDLSEGLNCVVGRNGSGKSNFFLAIAFALGDAKTKTRREVDRLKYLHQGAGARALNAYVKIAFDNEDRRLPYDEDEVTIQRTVGNKKDEFFINNNRVSAPEVANILETAGFSDSNAYYIVEQGKVTTLAQMKAKQRLEMLKGVAGTSVYDEKREKSLALLSQSSKSLEHIEEQLSTIEKRVTELDKDSEQLREFEKLDSEHTQLKYALAKKRLDDNMARQEELEEKLRAENETVESTRGELAQVQAEMQVVEEQLNQVASTVSSKSKLQRDLEEARVAIVDQATKLDLEIRSLKQMVEVAEGSEEEREAELVALQKVVRSTRSKLAEVGEALRTAVEEERAAATELQMKEDASAALYGKTERANQFRTQKERDTYLRKEIRSAKERVSGQEADRELLKESIREQEGAVAQMKEELSGEERKVEHNKARLDELNQEYNRLYRKRDEEMDHQKELWRRERELTSYADQLGLELGRAENSLKSLIGKVVFNALSTVNKLKVEMGIDGVLGPLIELVSFSESYTSAVEAVSGNKLFHVVVDSADTAERLVKLLQRNEQGGRITFIPLDQVRHPTRVGSEGAGEDYFPLHSVLECDDDVRDAVDAVFGRVMVVRTIDVGEELLRSEEHDCDCVTLEGDKLSRKGYLMGGYHDLNRSRVVLFEECSRLKDEMESTRAELEEVKAGVARASQVVTKLGGEIGALDSKKKNVMVAIEQSELKRSELVRRIELGERELAARTERLSELEAQLALDANRVGTLEAELGSKMRTTLSKAEEAELATLASEMEGLKERMVKAARARMEVQMEAKSLEERLRGNLEPQIEALQSTQNSVDNAERAHKLQRRMEEQARVEANQSKSEADLQEVKAVLGEAREQEHALRVELEKLRARETRMKRVEQEEDTELDVLRSQRKSLKDSAEQYMEEIRGLGFTGTSAEQYMAKSESWLVSRLKEVNVALAPYEHVNKKAMQQLGSSRNKYEELVQRKATTEKELVSIQQLIEELDEAKVERIDNTFRLVQEAFARVFSELVPEGEARLVLEQAEDGEEEEGEEDGMEVEDKENTSGRRGGRGGRAKGKGKARSKKQQLVDSSVPYVGVGIEAVFQEGASFVSMEMLSGGQKSLVALALIFAIQELERAPFYLLDEVDAALDPTHRAAVARKIEQLARNGTQFVCTTFHPEIVEKADKIYGVTSGGKESTISEIEFSAAAQMIADDEEGE